MTPGKKAPLWCGNGHFRSDRFESCGVFSDRGDIFALPSGKLVGQIFFNYVDYAYSSPSISTWRTSRASTRLNGARHIAAAQASGLPGARGSGAYLRRLVNPKLQRRNRSSSCKKYRPPGREVLRRVSVRVGPARRLHQWSYVTENQVLVLHQGRANG